LSQDVERDSRETTNEYPEFTVIGWLAGCDLADAGGASPRAETVRRGLHVPVGSANIRELRRDGARLGRQTDTAVSYRLLLAGDEIVDHPLSADDLSACRLLLVPDRENLLSADHELLAKRMAKGACFVTVSEALAQTTSAVRVEPPGHVRALPRAKPGTAVRHLLNYEYDAARDDVQPLSDIRVLLNLSELGVANATTCRWVTPDTEPIVLRINSSRVQVPTLGLWGLLVFGDP